MEAPKDDQGWPAAKMSYLDSQVAGNNRPLYPKVDHYWIKVAHNSEPLALQVLLMVEILHDIVWVVVKIMVPFWVPQILGAVVCSGPNMGPEFEQPPISIIIILQEFLGFWYMGSCRISIPFHRGNAVIM